MMFVVLLRVFVCVVCSAFLFKVLFVFVCGLDCLCVMLLFFVCLFFVCLIRFVFFVGFPLSCV